MEYELYHWGVKGMKWGVRRYQNRDGSLTPAGKKRYDKEMEKLKAEEKLIRNKERTKAKLDKLEAKRKELSERSEALDPKKAKKSPVEEKKEKPVKVKPKDIKDMTTEELQARKARLQLEKEYKQLLNETRDKNLTKGKSFVENVLTRSGEALASQVVNHFGAKGLNHLIGERDKDGNLVDVIFANNKKKN